MNPRHLLLPAFSIVTCLSLVACDDTAGTGDGGVDAMGTADAGTPDGGAAEVPPIMTGDCATLVTTSTLKESIDVDTTLSGVIAVAGAVRSGAAKITIEAGTTFIMGADSSIEFGWNSNVASVFARGTAAAPIRFCGRAATPGLWKSVTIGLKVTSDSVFENVVLSGGGQTTGAALELEAPISIKNVSVVASGADGVQAVDFKEGSTGLTVTGAAKVPVALLKSGGATHFPVGGTFTANTNNVIALRFDSIDLDTTIKNPGIPYLQEQTVQVMAPVKLTFEAGVDYRLAVDTNLEVGWNGNAASLAVNGTAAAPVLFGRASTAAGMWKSIIIQRMVKSDSVISYATISGGGNTAMTEPALDVRASITVKNLTLDGNKNGLGVEGPGFGPTSTALTITRTMGPPATVTLVNAHTLPKGGAYTGNTNDWIIIKDGDLAAGTATLSNLGVPYRIEGHPQTSMTGSLVIEAGTTFLMAPDSDLEIGWNGGPGKITAIGTAAAPIVFKGAQDTVGYWDGLLIGTMVAGDSKMAYVQISNGGKLAGGGLRLLKMGFDVTNSKFSKSAGYGIFKYLGDPTDFAAAGTGNTFDMNALGPVGPL